MVKYTIFGNIRHANDIIIFVKMIFVADVQTIHS